MPRNRNKYGNKITTYLGVKYHSKLEATYAKYLESQKRKHKIKKWERQKRVNLDVNGKRITAMVVDFVVYYNDDSYEYVEIKGKETDVWKLKYKLLQALYPKLPYIVLFRKDLKNIGLEV